MQNLSPANDKKFLTLDESFLKIKSKKRSKNKVKKNRNDYLSHQHKSSWLKGEITMDEYLEKAPYASPLSRCLKINAKEHNISIFRDKNYVTVGNIKMEFSYKNLPLLKSFVSKFFKLVPKRISGLKRPEQLKLKKSVAVAKFLALMNYNDNQF